MRAVQRCMEKRGGWIDGFVGCSRDNTLATMLGAKQGSEDDLDEVFDSLDSDNSNSITRAEWHDFVSTKSKACFHGTHSWGACMRGMHAHRD